VQPTLESLDRAIAVVAREQLAFSNPAQQDVLEREVGDEGDERRLLGPQVGLGRGDHLDHQVRGSRSRGGILAP